MLHPRTILLTLAIVSCSLAGNVQGGEIFIGPSNCWCDATLVPGFHFIPVYRSASSQDDCDVANVAFRLEGVPEDPTIVRSFDAFGAGGMTGDPFGDGAVVYDLIFAPGNTEVGWIRLEFTTPLPPQVWSVQAHRGIPGTTTPVAQFESAPGVWMAEVGLTTGVNRPNPDCDACPPIFTIGCPFAVEPGTWSGVKGVYR